MHTKALILPDWHGGASDTWPRRWAAQWGHTVVEQSDWQRPRRGDWLARLDEVVVDMPGDGPELHVVAHGLGCILLAAWAAVSRHRARIRAALLVAPTDVAQPDQRHRLPGWAPIVRQPLPFAATVVASGPGPGPDGHGAWAQRLAQDWGAHLHTDSGLGDWPQGRALWHALTRTPADCPL